MTPKKYTDTRIAIPPQNPTRDDLFEYAQKFAVMEEEKGLRKKFEKPNPEVDALITKYAAVMDLGFHYKDGWYFKRLEDGSVQVTKTAAGPQTENIVTQAVIDVDSWASIVASVSVKGDNAESFEAARKFHNE